MTSTTIQSWLDEADARAAASTLDREGIDARVRERAEVWSLEVHRQDVALAAALLELRALRAPSARSARRPRLSAWLGPSLAFLSGGALVALLTVARGTEAALPSQVIPVDVDGDGVVDGLQREASPGTLRVAQHDDDRDGRFERAVIVAPDGRVSTTWHDDDADGVFDRVRRVDPATGRSITLVDRDGDGFPEELQPEGSPPRRLTRSVR
ncbi:MAG TPA: hypothetical protein RMH99_24290 [Sandaracinaceae bacterium LLY-WYZ-13_1]|nr:hypothetical protein [Sandaracinaceae bacterium LLY-WYZ-13_1]